MKIDTNRLAPVVVVAFNRPDALKSSLASLARNPLAENSDVFVFVDGPRESRPGEEEKVKNVISVAKAASGFKSVTVKASEQNKGLSKSVIGAATQLINQLFIEIRENVNKSSMAPIITNGEEYP